MKVVKVTEDVQIEVLLTLGSGRNAAFGRVTKDVTEGSITYWGEVWEFLDDRYPDMFKSGEFPMDWSSDADHEADMDILCAIHRWQEDRQHE